MDWFIVISLILIGILLLLVELIFVPGTTFVGITGSLLVLAGIWVAYSTLGTSSGHVVLALSVLVSAVAVFYGFRSASWRKITLKETNDSHVNAKPVLLEEGQTGLAVSALRPSGTGSFGERHYEVHTRGEYLPAGTSIRIVKIINNKVTVEKTLP